MSFNEVPELPKAALALLNKSFTLSTSKVESVHKSSDGETTKMIIQLQDGLKIESVIMCYDTRGRYQEEADDDEHTSLPLPHESSNRPKGHRRATLCVSSQVGCQMGCTFCSTGTMGLKGNLSCGEILEQLVFANSLGLCDDLEGAKIKNVVFMGMGEPLDNYNAVKASVKMMTHPSFFGLGQKQVTISTVGIIPRIRTLVADLPGAGFVGFVV